MQRERRHSVAPVFVYRGLITPVFTPFHKDGKLNLSVVPRYAEYLHSSEIEAILVNGTTGEGTSLTVEERMEVLEAWLQVAQEFQLMVMVQVGGVSMEDVKRLAQHAERSRASAILCLPDLFFRPSNVDDLIHYLSIVAAAAPRLPLLYYHIPEFTGINMNMRELLDRIQEVPTLVGIKFTDSNLAMGSLCVADHLKQHAVFLGCDSLCLSALFLGFNSAIATTSNMYASYFKQIFRSFRDKEYEKAAKAQNSLNNCIQKIIAHGPWVSSMKAAMRKLTPIDVGPVRDPLIEVSLNEGGLGST